MKTNEIFLSNASIMDDFVKSFDYPYEVLPNIKDAIIKKGETLGSDYIKKDDNIWIHKTAKVAPSASITGPAIIDEDAEIRHCAFIRGSVVIGKRSILGNSCEAKNSIIYDDVQTPHFNYIGDAILGSHSHMGAGCIISNIKSDRKNVVIKEHDNVHETNLRKVGAFLGDNVEVGCNSVLNPGTVVMPNSRIYPLTCVRGYIEENSIVKSMDNIVKRSDI